MPKASENETGWGRKGVERGTSPLKPREARNESVAPAALPWKNFGEVFYLALALIAVGLTLLFFQMKTEAPRQQSVQGTLSLGNQEFFLEVADESAELTTGLSGRARLGEEQGMLFVFDQPGDQCMWMKDMNFSLDMIWLDENKKIIKIEKNVKPETYPKIFCSTSPAQYVIEVNAGVADRANLKVDQTLQF